MPSTARRAKIAIAPVGATRQIGEILLAHGFRFLSVTPILSTLLSESDSIYTQRRPFSCWDYDSVDFNGF